MFAKSLPNLFTKTKNRKHKIRCKSMRPPDEFILNGESLSNKASIIEKYENTKTVKLDRTHQEDLSETSQLSAQTLLIIYLQPTSHLSHTAFSVSRSHETTSQLIPRINQPSGHHMNYTNKRSINTR